MCGITGAFAFNENGKAAFSNLDASIAALGLRGPDGNGSFVYDNVALGHTRLAILDTSEAANQPFYDATGRYTIIFNGEIYNFKEVKKELGEYTFRTTGDTEVLLYCYIKYGKECVNKLNGFFAFAVYDKEEKNLFIARDRMGIKPLLVYQDENKLLFASEMKALLAFGMPREIDRVSLWQYLQFNYIPAPNSIFKGVKKLLPGHYMMMKGEEATIEKYYEIPYEESPQKKEYETVKKELEDHLEASVQKRLISDVPLGAFLSGGIDSSVVVALASRHTQHLNTFSIGYKDEPLFDETGYAKLVADKFKTNHTVFSLTNDDLFANLHSVLDYIDEPFADSSALAVHILSMHTRKHVTVALSGDGADELFSGYNKHAAEFRSRYPSITELLVKLGTPLWKALPQSRNSKLGNLARQLSKFGEGMGLSADERYWQWASFYGQDDAKRLMKLQPDETEYLKRKSEILKYIKPNDFNSVLYTDLQMVLVNDMLVKVDSMSMANSLEVRVPFLDHNIVKYVMKLPVEYKIDRQARKRVLQDAFRNILPPELYHRPKHGFEVPLLKWFRSELKEMITSDLLESSYIKEQGVFNPNEVRGLLNRLYSNNPGDAATQVWNLIVFQNWYRKYID